MFKFRSQFLASDITDEDVFLNRRKVLKALGFSAAALAASPASAGVVSEQSQSAVNQLDCQPDLGRLPQYPAQNSLKEISRYNNYFEFSTEKKLVHIYAKEFQPTPWSITIDGEVDKPQTLDLEQILSWWTQEERIYSLRCVEGWSMVIPWNGFSLCRLLKRVAPNSRAKYVEFVSVSRPEQMIGQRRPVLNWPYREVLTIEEAMHPLTILASGIYGKPISNQNGAPIRLVVPWKYGFKSIKAITHIRLSEKQPSSTWMQANPENYGFFANVNPKVSTSSWSQRKELRIGSLRKQKTLLFNGYQDQVAHLYQGMDLKKFF